MGLNVEQKLRNPEIQPTIEVIAQELKEATSSYSNFVQKLVGYNIQLEWRYYTDGKAWLGKGLYRWTGARGGQKETTVFWLSIWDGFFRITIYLREEARVKALELAMDEEIKQMVRTIQKMGKMNTLPISFNICSEELFDSIFTMIDFKKSLDACKRLHI